MKEFDQYNLLLQYLLCRLIQFEVYVDTVVHSSQLTYLLVVLIISMNFCLKHYFYGVVLCSLTDVAALACGREFLVSSSRELLDTMMHLLGDMKPGLCTKFKVYDDFFFFSFQMKCIILQCRSQ